jgi:hypothetical protein
MQIVKHQCSKLESINNYLIAFVYLILDWCFYNMSDKLDAQTGPIGIYP